MKVSSNKRSSQSSGDSRGIAEKKDVLFSFSTPPIYERLTALGVFGFALLWNYFFWVRGRLGGFAKIEIHGHDAMDYACAARNLARGLGFTEQIVTPSSFSLFHTIPHPTLSDSALPVLTTPFFAWCSSPEFAAVFPVWLCYGLLASFAYLLARTLINWKWSLATALLVLICPRFLKISVVALPTLPTVVVFLWLFWAMIIRARPSFCGFLYGIICYLSPGLTLFLPLALWGYMVAFDRSRKYSATWVIFGSWVAVFWPWMARNLLLLGNPFYGLWGVSWSTLGTLLLIPGLIFLVNLVCWSFAQRQKIWVLGGLLALVIYAEYSLVHLRFELIFPMDRLSVEQSAFLIDKVSPKQTVGSDLADAIAWQCDRMVLALPQTDEEFRKINVASPVDFVYFPQGQQSPLLQKYLQGGWFSHEYIRQGRKDSQHVLYARRDIRDKTLSQPQFIHFRNGLSLYVDGEIVPINEDVVDEKPIMCPPDVIRIRRNSWNGGINVLTAKGQVWTLGSENALPFVPEVGDIVDFCTTPSGKGCFFLVSDGSVAAWGQEANLPSLRSFGIPAPWRIEVTATGKGYYVLGRFGQVGAFGDAVSGISPSFYPKPLAADLALAPGGNGYYVLDSYGGIHSSSPSLPLLNAGHYDVSDSWAVDLEILDNGSASILSKEGVIYNCTTTIPSP